MTKLNNLALKVLQTLEPDKNKWEQWLEKKPLSAVLQTPEVQAFTERIHQAQQNHEKVFIFGDYDADGILATTIMVLALKKLNIEVGFYIPDRIKEGYGLNKDKCTLAHEKGYDLIITVDNGVAANEEVMHAQRLGMDVIVTDHHQIAEDSEADIFIHPSDLGTPYSNLCGAGVAFELSRALNTADDYQLQLACIADIADVMKVTGETRAIIQQGIASLNEKPDLRISSLADTFHYDETEIGFQIVPKLNSVGRLANRANANNIVRYFISDEPLEILQMAKQIRQINESRKQISNSMAEHARKNVNPHDPVLLIVDPGYHEGIIGLVANNLCQTFNKPAIVLTSGNDGYKGSMRAPDGFDCMDFLSGFEHFQTKGGHKGAAGFSLDLKYLDAFKEFVRKKGAVYTWQKEKKKEVVITDEDISVKSIESLDALRPFGPGFEMPVFKLENPKIKRLFDIQNGRHRKYTLESGLQCMRFNQSEEESKISAARIASFEGSLQINRYQGKKQPSFIIEKINYK